MALNASEQYYSDLVASFDPDKIKKPQKQGMMEQKDKIKAMVIKGHSLTEIALVLNFHRKALSKFCIDNWGNYYRKDWGLT